MYTSHLLPAAESLPAISKLCCNNCSRNYSLALSCTRLLQWLALFLNGYKLVWYFSYIPNQVHTIQLVSVQQPE